MDKKKTLFIALAFGVMPIATAQTDTQPKGIPFAITFDGSYYPDNLETIEYPHTAAVLQKGGECLLNVMTDSAGNISGVNIQTCTDISFRDVTARFIRNQGLNDSFAQSLESHELRVKWEIGEPSRPDKPIQVAAR